MRHFLPIVLLALCATSCANETSAKTAPAGPDGVAEPKQAESSDPAEKPEMTKTSSGLYALTADALGGDAVDLSAYSGQVTLVVNVASECGYTRQYAGLQALHAELQDHGFAVLGFPSNEFGGQEPGSAEEILQFCSERFAVSFPMFEKIEVKPGSGQSPVYSFLEEQSGEVPGWNFCKYLVGKDGQVLGFFASSVEPDAAELRDAIEAAIG